MSYNVMAPSVACAWMCQDFLDVRALRGLYVFRHDSQLGNASAYTLFERIHVTRTADVPRSFAGYEVFVNDAEVPSGVTLLRKI
ncbi:hypothetical protein [Acidithiobacillus sulfurivorans]|uniref:Type I CRISPR-associated protein Cas7 n=1 Tax=Acidithiobacillus sulfurivorans TaxID=1958756 RepID=A0ABS5ZZT5_9PROT|nr:hypothetical protein [Acidithiobacillus sulfurivorans]MBU2760742.1 type I CRISPR-associated protein Cas7 [Acidithiobacillus sulfurivorans]